MLQGVFPHDLLQRERVSARLFEFRLLLDLDPVFEDIIHAAACPSIFIGRQGKVIAFAPDSRTLATGSVDHTVKLWDVGTGKERLTLTGNSSWVYAVAFAPDGKTLASAGYDRTVRIWDASSGQLVGSPLKAGTLSVVSVA